MMSGGGLVKGPKHNKFKERADAAGMYQGYMMKDLQEDKITLNEFTLLILISSRTLAWGKRFDFIPRTYFKMGKNGAKLTGLRDSLISKGYIAFTPSKKVHSWSKYELINLPFNFIPQYSKAGEDTTKGFDKWMNSDSGMEVFTTNTTHNDKNNEQALAITKQHYIDNIQNTQQSKRYTN